MIKTNFISRNMISSHCLYYLIKMMRSIVYEIVFLLVHGEGNHHIEIINEAFNNHDYGAHFNNSSYLYLHSSAAVWRQQVSYTCASFNHERREP